MLSSYKHKSLIKVATKVIIYEFKRDKSYIMVNVKRWEDGDKWVVVDLDRCVGASNCVGTCPAEVYSLVNGKVVAEDITDCIECLACQDACPTNAILKHFAW